MNTPTNTVEVINAVKHYKQRSISAGAKNRAVKAVDGVSFTLGKGEVLGVIGESGCGKSTLARLLVKLEPLTSGDIRIDGKSIGGINTGNRDERLAFRRTAQLIFQNPFECVDPREIIEKVMITPLRLHSIGQSDKERLAICAEALEQAGLNPAKDFLARYPHELSGGQLQRIAVMRAMSLSPRFVVADEAVSMLDTSVRADILNLLKEQVAIRGASMVFISHDIAATRYVSDSIACMYLGRIVETGLAEDIAKKPVHPYTRALISNSASIDPSERRNPIDISGEPPSPVGTGPGCYFAPRCFMRGKRCNDEYPKTTNINESHSYTCFYAD